MRSPFDSVPEGYAEHAPPAELRGLVECFWTRRLEADATPPRAHRVLPDGCVDIIVSFAGDDAPRAVGVGAMTRPIVVGGDRSSLSVGVRFRPGRALAAFGLPATELTDETVPWSTIAGDAEHEASRLATITRPDERLRAVVAMIARRFAGAAAPPPSVREGVRRIVAADGTLRIGALAAELGITRQQLARQFAVHVGVSPKMLARVMRVRAAIARADAARAANPHGVDWSALAYDLGYSDQPHLVDEFKAITGITPGRWAARGQDGEGES